MAIIIMKLNTISEMDDQLVGFISLLIILVGPVGQLGKIGLLEM